MLNYITYGIIKLYIIVYDPISVTPKEVELL